MNLIDVTKSLATEDQCLDFLERMRWPEGVRCPLCGNDKVSRIVRKTASKNKRDRFYACLEPSCNHRFSVTAGTVFHRSHLPLAKWFMAMAIVMDAKKGMSALQWQQHLGIGSYRTAWYMVHRIRKAMVDLAPTKLSCIVEIDETYIQGNTIRRKDRGNRKWEQKDAVIGMVERGGKLRLRHIGKGSATSKTVGPLVRELVDRDVDRVITD